jgi:hypothetical protein
MHRLREHSCHSEYNVHCPKVFIYWFMMLVSLVLKLFVSSRSLKLQGVLCIYVFLSHKGQAKNHLYVFPYDLNTCLTFIVSFSWSFVCVLFSCYNMVAKFLLSRLYLSCPCFKFFWSQHLMLYIDDQDCVDACHLKNYFFCYHLPTRGRARVKLGDADMSQMYL